MLRDHKRDGRWLSSLPYIAAKVAEMARGSRSRQRHDRHLQVGGGDQCVAARIVEGLDEMLTVNRLGPAKLRRSLACTNSIENMMGTVRRVCRNVNRWQNAANGTALDRCRHVGGGERFGRLKAYKHLPVHRAALQLINPSISPTS